MRTVVGYLSHSLPNTALVIYSDAFEKGKDITDPKLSDVLEL